MIGQTVSHYRVPEKSKSLESRVESEEEVS
jgi:hypothetical protein